MKKKENRKTRKLKTKTCVEVGSASAKGRAVGSRRAGGADRQGDGAARAAEMQRHRGSGALASVSAARARIQRRHERMKYIRKRNGCKCPNGEKYRVYDRILKE